MSAFHSRRGPLPVSRHQYCFPPGALFCGPVLQPPAGPAGFPSPPPRLNRLWFVQNLIDDYKPQDLRKYGNLDKIPVNLQEVGTGYRSWFGVINWLSLGIFFAAIAFIYAKSSMMLISANELASNLSQRYEQLYAVLHGLETDLWIVIIAMSVFLAWGARRFLKQTSVYLLDFVVLDPDLEYMIDRDFFMQRSRDSGFFTDQALDFQEKILRRSGLGDHTYFPPGIVISPMDLSMQSARDEFLYVAGKCCDELFQKTGVDPSKIDLIVVNCSLFNPTPSLSAMIINRYKMRDNIRNYNLSGMGCSAGVISLDLAKDLLQVHGASNCLVISTENITQNWYHGNQRNLLLSNCLFRMGCAAVLLTNKPQYASRAKYELLHTVRVHHGASDESLEAVYQIEDPDNLIGVRLSKDLINVVSKTLRSNLTTLGPLILPISEQLKFFINLVQTKYLGFKNIPRYTPDFRKAVQHFCIHAGGRAVIDGLEQNLQLTPDDVLPSRATLNRVGNTSSSSIWYELSFIEYSARIKKGDRIWQIAFGSGMKCNSAIWKALRPIHDRSRDGFWALTGGDGLADDALEALARVHKHLAKIDSRKKPAGKAVN
ncbi:hypothetical protein, variant [Fonticula alba]|uniref:very-long-chain 3-oxoacyl-CoA synthase n=1 Tax=Fonticula alba TaxID=691883 RepID=A0A058ZGE8_FONAL|nr:hypothetical protein, variant [Fonticula alba]KCV73026.1 hypothetical protein, variant [Fonticula alba]|eukprot:XP_009492727.1 hypothetical protein, variant [Fonticula alba]